MTNLRKRLSALALCGALTLALLPAPAQAAGLTLICGDPEHAHTGACYAQPEAPAEDSAPAPAEFGDDIVPETPAEDSTPAPGTQEPIVPAPAASPAPATPEVPAESALAMELQGRLSGEDVKAELLAGEARYNTELLVNGDASQEMYYWGTWTCIGDGTPAAKSAPGEVDPTGSGYTLPIFMGGSSEYQVTDASQNASSMWQGIDLNDEFKTSNGKAKYTLSAVIGGYSGDTDYAIVQAQFKNSSDAVISTTELNSGHASGDMTTYTKSGTMPSGTAKVNIEVKFYKDNRDGNKDCDGYVDNISFKVTENKCVTLTYSANGGSGAPAAETVNYNQSHTLSATKPTRRGYTFDGWFNANTGGSVITSDTPKVNTTYSASWTPNTYNYTFGSTTKPYTFNGTSLSITAPALPANSGNTFYTGWKYTGGGDGGSLTTGTIYQPGETVNLTDITGDLTFEAQSTTVSGTPATSETLTIARQATPPAPPTKYTYTVKVTGNDALTALTIGGVTVTRATAADNFVLTSTDRAAKAVTVNGENAGTVAADGTLTLNYKTLTVTVNKDKAVTLGNNGPSLVRTVSGSTYTYTDTKLNAGSVSYPILVDGEPTGKTAAYGSTTALTYHTATANITVQPGAAVNSVELVGGGKALPMSLSGGKYTYTGLSGSGTYTLRVNGVTVGGQYTNFASDTTLSTTIYARTATTKLNGVAADVPGVGKVSIGGMYAARTGVGAYLVTQVGASLTNNVSVNGQRVPASNGIVNYYTVSYTAGSGTGAPVDPNVYLSGTSATVLGPGAMTRPGYTFMHWQDLSMPAGETVTVNRSVILSAIWKENSTFEAVWQTPGGEPHYGTLDEALEAAETTPDVTVTVQNDATAHGSATIPETATLVVPEGKTVTVDGPVENKGTIENSGTITGGTLTNTGDVDNDGTLDATVTNNGEIDNQGGTVSGTVTNTGTVEGGTVTGTVSGGTVSGPLTNEGTITGATVTGPVTLPPGGTITDSAINGTVDDQGGTISDPKDGTGSVSTPGGPGTGSTPEEKLVDALGGAAVMEDGVVKLVADVDLTDDPIVIDDDVTIDLNGHTVTGPEGKPAVQVTGGNVKIEDSSEPDSGSIEGGGGAEGQPGGAGVEVSGTGSVTVGGGSVTGGSGGAGGEGGSGISNTGTGSVNIESGAVTGGTGGLGEPSGAGGSGVSNSGSGSVSVTGGQVEGGPGGSGGQGGNGVTNTGTGGVDVTGGGVSGGTGGRTGEGDGGNGGQGVSNPGGGPVNIQDGADVTTGDSGVGGDGKVTPRKVETPTIAPIPDQVYTGAAIAPAVTLYDGRDVIPAGEYDVTYVNNVDVGTATVTVKDKADKTDAKYAIAETTFDVAFQITPKPVTLIWSGHQELVYSGSPVNVTAAAGELAEGDTCAVTVTGGTQTNAGDYTATATGLSNTNYKLPDGDLTVDYTIDPKPISLIWAGDQGLVYNGSPVNVTATAGDLVGSDACTVTVAGGQETAAGTHTATARLLDNPNYKLPETVTKTYTIAKATPALSGLSATDITYGDALSASAPSGAANHPTTGVTVPGGWSWTAADASTTYPTVVTDSGVTAYTVTFTPTDGDNYNTNTAAVTLTVHKATLTPSVNTVTDKVYDGNTAATGTVKLAGAKFTDAPEAAGTFAFNSANVTEANAVNVADIALTGGWDGNYVLSTDALSGIPTAARITPKPVTLIWNGADGLVYDRQPVNVTAAAGALVEGDTCAVTVEGGQETNAGTYTAEAVSLGNPNYKLPAEVTRDYTIAKCPVTFTVTGNDQDYHHGGHPKAEVTAPGLTKDTEFTVSYRQTGQVIEPHFSGTYDIMVELTDPNFKFEGQTDDCRELKVGDLTINHVSYEGAITWPTASNPITYGQPLSDVAFAGGSGSDAGGTGVFFWDAPDSYPDVATTKAVMVFDPDDPEYDNVEYEVDITVNRAVLTPSVASAADKVYDGATATTGTLSLAGAQFDEAPTAAGAFDFVDKNAQENKAVNVTAIALTDSWNANYVLSTETLSAIPTAAKITPKPVTLTWDGYQDLVYSGKPVNVTAAAGSLVEGDTCAVTVDDEGRATHAGPHTAAATALSNPNYKLPEVVTWDYAIAPKPVTLLWHNMIQPYNGTDRTPRAVPSLDAANGASAVTLQGVVPEDDGTADVVFTVTQNGQGAQAVNAGTYTVSGAMKPGSNYAVTGYASAQLTVQKAPLTFTVTDNALKEGEPYRAPTITTDPADVPFTVVYKDEDGQAVDPEAEDLKTGTYTVWASLTDDDNYHHAGSAGGDPMQIGVFTVYAQDPPKTYAVTFEAQDPEDEPGADGGVIGVLSGSMEPLTADQAGAVRVLPPCAFTCTGYAFAGWELDGRVYPAGAAYTQASQDVTFTARWVKAVHSVEGVVDRDGKPISDVQVTLMLGANVIAQRHTDAQGRFTFENIAPGLYNLVVTRNGVTMTVEAAIVDRDEARGITLPTHKTNSVVVVAPGTPNVVVGNLENNFTDEDKALAAMEGVSTEVEYKFTVRQEPADENDPGQTAIREAAGRATPALFLELTLEKTVTEGDSVTTNVMPESNVLIQSVIPLPAELQGKYRYAVLRCHGDEVETLEEEAPNDAGEYFTVNEDQTVLTIYARKFSTYAVAYADRHSGVIPYGSGTRPVCPRDESCPAYPFTDLDLDAWYHDGIHFCVDRELMIGTSKTTFAPEMDTSRAMIATILWRLRGSKTASGTIPYPDVPDGTWYTEAVRWATQEGVVKGYGDGNFGPADPITREQLAAMLYRYEQKFGSGGFTGSWMFLLDFHDADQVNPWASEAVHWMTMHKVIQGKDDKTLDPQGQATRAEAAAILQRYIQLDPK